MSQAPSVACKVCGREAAVYARALGSASQIDHALPIGWLVRQEQDERTGKLEVVVYCPLHKPNDDA